jgi:hypothetical protein
MTGQAPPSDAETTLPKLFARPSLPGQDPAHADRLLDHLRRACEPRDFIEELWLADIA